MFVFIDESGDPGFDFERGSSKYFVIATAIFKTSADCDRARKALNGLMAKLRCFPEFKFARTSHEFKLEFFRICTQSEVNVKITALVVDKSLIKSAKLRSNCRYFYQYFCRLAIESNRESLNAARIIIDGCGSKEMKRDFSAYLRKECGTKDAKFKSFEFADSKKEILVQLADMFAGLCHRNRTEIEDNIKTRKLREIADYFERSAIMSVWEFGRRV